MIELDAVLSNADWAKRTPDTLEHMDRVARGKAGADASKTVDKPNRSRKKKGSDGGAV